MRRLGVMMSIAAWVLGLLLLTWMASTFLEKEYNPNSELPVSLGAQGLAEVRLQRNHYGHFVASGEINGQSVVMLVDTGATDVAIDDTLAERIGLERRGSVVNQTANGEVLGWRTLLSSVRLGSIELNAVPAVILPNLGNEVLLGMSFLKRLTMVQRGDELLLQKGY